MSSPNTFVPDLLRRIRIAGEPGTRHEMMQHFARWKSRSTGRGKDCGVVAYCVQQDLYGHSTVSGLCKTLRVSERQIHRLFRREIGVSPKIFLRFLRFERSYAYFVLHPTAPYVEVAELFGYSDAAHLIREFRAFGGAPPRQLLLTPPGSNS